MNVTTTDVPSGTAVSATASPAISASAVVSLPIVVAAVAVIVGLGIIVLIVNRLRKLDPVAFRRAISNGGAFQGVLLLAHLADVGLDIAACVTVIADPTTSPMIAGLFGVLTAIALTVSAIEVTVDVRTMWRLTRNKLDIDGAAELQRQVSAAETLTLLAEDLPMLLIAGSLQFAATRSSEPKDPTTSTYLLLVVIFSAIMIGMKLNNVRPLLNRLLADRTYEENCAEMAQLSSDDLRTLESVLCDYDIFETLQRRRQSGSGSVDDDVDKSRSVVLSVSTNNNADGGSAASHRSIEDVLRMSAHDPSDGAFDLQRRIFRLLRDLSCRPLDMDSPQSHLDALAVVLELAYPHRYGHLERSAEATAQALTEAAVSQSEFYAVVLPYLMLLYDKEGAPSAPSARAGEVAADKADNADINTNALAGLAGGVHVSGDEEKRSDSDDDEGQGTSPHIQPMQRNGFSMVRVVRMREEELERLATVQNLRPMSRATATTLPRPQLQLTVHSASDDARAPPLSPMVPPNSSSPHHGSAQPSRRFSAAACARLGLVSLHDVPVVASPGLKNADSAEGFAVSVEAPQPQSPAAIPVRPQPPSSMRKLASRTRRQLERQIVMFADDGLDDDDDDDELNTDHRQPLRPPAADDTPGSSSTAVFSAAPGDDDVDGESPRKRYSNTRTFVAPSDATAAAERNESTNESGHDELSPPLAVAPSSRTLRRRQSAAYLNTRARFIHAVRQAMPHRR